MTELRNGKNVYCYQTGEIYKNVKETAKALSLNEAQISQHLLDKLPSVKGYLFTRAIPSRLETWPLLQRLPYRETK